MKLNGAVWFGAGLLILLTILALLPVDPQGPFDARDYHRAHGVELEFPFFGSLLEPLLAPAAAFGGEPDVRIAAGVSLIWIILLSAMASLAREIRLGRQIGFVTLISAAVAGAAGGGMFLCYIGFVLLVPLPGWKLVTTDPELVVVDLQTHTVYSRDGLVTPEQNLILHRERGFHVVAFTEHDSPAGTMASTAYSYQDETLPYALVGTEVRDPGDAFLLSIGWVPEQKLWSPQWLSNLDREPVIALAWKLDVKDVRRLADAGLSGFEIANAGHPDIPMEVREAILEEAQKRGLVLVSSSDWHGWSGLWRTWTTVRVPGAAQMSRSEKAEAVVEALRQRRSGDIQPVVAGYLGPPSLLRKIFAPFSALVRYGMELSPVRLAVWWGWGVLALLLGWWLSKKGLRPVHCMSAMFLGVLGTGMILQGGRLLALSMPGMAAKDILYEVGSWGVGLGGVALSFAVLIVFQEFRNRAERIRTSEL